MFFFFNHPATAEISTLSLHDALPICLPVLSVDVPSGLNVDTGEPAGRDAAIEAAVTLTIGASKEGLLRSAAWPFVGWLEVATDVGLTASLSAADWCWTLPDVFAGYPLRR